LHSAKGYDGKLYATWESQKTNVLCPFCGYREDKVIDSRESKEADVIRRRRQCLKCEKRFTSYERIEEVPFLVVKKDGRREKFDRQKVLGGLLRASEKRPVGMGVLAGLVDDVESRLAENAEREISTTAIGELLMEKLRGIDHVAFVRFASVYRDFQDVENFLDELNLLVRQKRVVRQEES
jgi:transcriptional repressor NrdR